MLAPLIHVLVLYTLALSMLELPTFPYAKPLRHWMYPHGCSSEHTDAARRRLHGSILLNP